MSTCQVGHAFLTSNTLQGWQVPHCLICNQEVVACRLGSLCTAAWTRRGLRRSC